MGLWQQRANARRDERRTAIPDDGRQRGGRKATRRWCRGRVGVAHTPRWVIAQRGVGSSSNTFGVGVRWLNYECTACGRIVDYWTGFLRSGPQPTIGSTEPAASTR